MINRRTFLAGAAALTTGLILPPSPTENAEAVRRYWSLDRTMMHKPGEWQIVFREPEHLGMLGYQAAAWRDRPDLPFGVWNGIEFVRREQYTSPPVFASDAERLGRDPRDLAIEFLSREMAYADKPIIL
jgi:hypothetical protein